MRTKLLALLFLVSVGLTASKYVVKDAFAVSGVGTMIETYSNVGNDQSEKGWHDVETVTISIKTTDNPLSSRSKKASCGTKSAR